MHQSDEEFLDNQKRRRFFNFKDMWSSEFHQDIEQGRAHWAAHKISEIQDAKNKWWILFADQKENKNGWTVE